MYSSQGSYKRLARPLGEEEDRKIVTYQDRKEVGIRMAGLDGKNHKWATT